MSGILIADDDPDVASFISLTLELEGFEVRVAHDGAEALQMLGHELPALVLLDLMMPEVDGIDVCRRLRADPTTSSLPVIMLTALDRPSDRVVGLEAGADDYILKPFDTLELVARVRSTLRRNSEMRAVSPLTGLPGNHRISDEIALRAASGQEFAVCHLDLDHFKAFNDRYSWVRGDEVISLVATSLRQAAAEADEPQPFIGHVGGDDFVAVCSPDQAESLCARCLELFDDRVRALHDPVDAERGFMTIFDRQGVERQVPLTTLSVGVATSSQRDYNDPREIVEIATEMKNVAKASAGSTVAVDRRGGSPDSVSEHVAGSPDHHGASA